MDQLIVDFLTFGIKKGYIHPMDRILKQNELLALLKKEELDPSIQESNPLPEAKTLIPYFIDYAVEKGIIIDIPFKKNIFAAKIMALLTPDASRLNEHFWEKYKSDSKMATDYFYQLSMDNDYIKMEDIAKNIEFEHDTKVGKLELTINLSKPEKDPKEIAAAKSQPTSSYPKCPLCMENEGYAGTLTHPARSNHRIVRFPLNGETWGLQYSPYAYYTEHCIFLAEEHRPMKINERTFENLFSIIEQFPHYFVGSNADLPIVGGSILSHDHYQGGKHTFAMDKASLLDSFTLPSFPHVKAGILQWPMSVIRLESMDKNELQKAAVYILDKWRVYSDPKSDVYSFTEDIPHNTVTPIARRSGEAFVCNLVLRNNRTTAEFPAGLFHPHPDVQHIKKENIGLIEVMGLAILPPRLKEELIEVEKFLRGEEHAMEDMHEEWARTISFPVNGEEKDVTKVVQEAIGEVFLHVLEDAGIYKLTKEGLEGFYRFIDTL
ncbi:UDP-glucose--hexose-1-phosphate uridylyltransferase [Jeotgalibaca sp. MA1X17-3]|uniref:UDP-glucose--hexose-1-phosphate uridylyltransferase n=1 Tax=Jeotgalibaca sp. MA1X17-3 TaxID=2908211 RepID=UPI001F2B3FAD|nr:UDP-glucose--hexose-1-phosphate uridylyltransferase [Jeotgalibaca sp. MA1X17-3]UJF15689.1 UDP-glucose--hexose-1-phosphate uridylyltransferase [Jeotgalibaca sp. MA1X17-3]